MSQRSSYARPKVIIHSRDSSVASRTSSSSKSSAEGYYSSPLSKTNMTDGCDPVDGLQYHRVPDNGLHPLIQTARTTTNRHLASVDKYMISKTTSTSRGPVEVHNHHKARHIAAEPRASQATYEDYERTQQTEEKPRK